MGDDIVAKFWDNVEKTDGCWNWTGYLDKDMYGRFKKSGQEVRAHHYSYELFLGRPVTAPLILCHTCDHPYCVNPYHLFPGTHLENIEDKVSKGRQAKGSKINTSKLTEQKVQEIRELLNSGSSPKKLSKLYGVSKENISLIKLNKIWRK